METWMLLRGLSRQKLHWGDFADHFVASTRHRIVFEDLPGFGSRNHEASPMSVIEIAQSIASAVFKQVDQHDGKINLIGISMGGMVALELARLYPEKVRCLVLINSSFKPYAHFYQRLKPAAYSSFLKAWCSPFQRYSERQILELSSNFRQRERALLDQWLILRHQQKPSHIAALRQVIAASRFSFPYLKPIEHVLLVASKQDRIVDYRCSENVAKEWEVPLALHHFAGHDLPLDSPEWLTTEIIRWRRSLRL